MNLELMEEKDLNKKLKTLLAGLMILMLAMAFIACEDTTKTAEEPAPAEDQQSEAPAEEPAAEGNDIAGKTITVISREEGSGTRGAFVEIVGVEDEEGNDATTVEAAVQSSTNAAMTAVENDPLGIAYISLGSLNETVKAVKIGGVEASVENIVSGDYPLQRPFNVAYTEFANEVAEDFFAFLKSEQAALIIEEEGYIRAEQDGSEYESKNLSGALSIGGSTSVAPVMEKLAEKYMELNPDVTIDIQATGSSAGIKAVDGGAVDFGMASRELKEEEQHLNALVLARDGIAVIVNNSNPIDDLSMEDIKAIYLGEKTEW